jgi:hypothetical protein
MLPKFKIEPSLEFVACFSDGSGMYEPDATMKSNA